MSGGLGDVFVGISSSTYATVTRWKKWANAGQVLAYPNTKTVCGQFNMLQWVKLNPSLPGVTKRTGGPGTTKHQRQHHAQCCNGHQTHSMQHGAQPVVWIHLGHEISRGHSLLILIVLYYCLLFRALCVSISAFSDVRVRTFMTWRWLWPGSPWPLYVTCDKFM